MRTVGKKLGKEKFVRLGQFLLGLLLMIPFSMHPNMSLISTVGAGSHTNYDAFKKYLSLNEMDLSIDAFFIAYFNYEVLKQRQCLKNDSILTIVDFSKPSNTERFFVVDIKNNHVLLKSLVAHGRNSGDLYANSFSNIENSLKSSLGLFITDSPYYGKHGYSMLLNGVEKGINDNARTRAIVVHGADYVSDNYVKNYGRLGRSFGCPALPAEYAEKVINIIKNGSCMYLYHPSKNQSSLQLALN
ncbi:MAG: murein L,D-transpeptidase catalytic domain family protein [Marinilabiliaceae bacterium]|nr:murein L,D-transpeptidase catalytic domain family protein [Marinilabiliaceae bacterium]